MAKEIHTSDTQIAVDKEHFKKIYQRALGIKSSIEHGRPPVQVYNDLVHIAFDTKEGIDNIAEEVMLITHYFQMFHSESENP